jgi:DNA-binding winged helix-turn-helix (wHTH) protein
MEKNCNIVRFDWQHERVTRGDITARVSGQEKVALRLMVEHAPALCTREQLMGAIWGQRAALMDELYLTQLVYRLRKSLRPLNLGDHIETLPRAGYRFVPSGLSCKIEEAAAAPLPEQIDPPSIDAARGAQRLWPAARWRQSTRCAGRMSWCANRRITLRVVALIGAVLVGSTVLVVGLKHVRSDRRLVAAAEEGRRLVAAVESGCAQQSPVPGFRRCRQSPTSALTSPPAHR